ncbi:hypothetical protein N7452_011453 [Penicillium brevicompactum]|uniref:Uncharacterized protein n=1 Tax=Penicillium brevicompactum TaxID=5074 RepID=A0A9W9U929_PENBR|nr:hypothetical protein N7452_011453 [Penicillium brevicompactum]
MVLDATAAGVPFSLNDLQVLAGEYLGGPSQGWDPQNAFGHLFGSGLDPKMFVLRAHLTALLGEIILVVNPGTPDACILRLNVAPEYLWVGIHWAGPEIGMCSFSLLLAAQFSSLFNELSLTASAPLSAYVDGLLFLCTSRPLIAWSVMHHSRPVQQWQSLMGALQQYLYSASSVGPTSTDVNRAQPGVERSPPRPVDTMIRDLALDMDICEVPGTGFAAAAPAPAFPPAATAAAPLAAPPISSCSAAAMFLNRRPRCSPSPDYEAASRARKTYRARC